MFTEFKKTLKKQELNRFEKVLKLYPTIPINIYPT